MRIYIEGGLNLPDGIDEDKFNELFLDFITKNNIDFTGATVTDEE